MKVLLCCILKMENHYLEEWLRHYVSLGIDKIVIFDNNDIEGKYAESIYDIEYVKECKNKGIIDVYPIPGEKQAQTRSYNKCYEMYGSEYDWLMFFDIDEFLMLEKSNNIKEFLSQQHFTPYEMIHINWKVYDDNDLLTVVNNDYSLVKRFTRPCQTRRSVHSELKTIIRGGLKDVKFIKSPHTCDNRTFLCCNAIGEKTDSKATKTNIIIHKESWLNHYICKTIEEFCYNKLVRRGGHTIHKKDLRYNLNFFFNYNRRSLDKIKFYKEHCNINNANIEYHYIDNATSIIMQESPEKIKTVKRTGTQSRVTSSKPQRSETTYVKRNIVVVPAYSPTTSTSKKTSIKNRRKLTVEEIARFPINK